jgi:RNA polymerase sigma-70 factor (ECF subfamily)
MVKAFRSRGSYDPSRPILPWLLAFVRNTSIDIRRSFDPLRDSGGADPDTLDNPGSAGTDPLAGADSEERRAAVEKALANLPVDQRSTVVLFYMEGLSLEEVAAAEGVAVGTVKSRLFRAREHLAELLVRFRT